LIQKETGKIFRVDFSEAFAPESVTIPGCDIQRCSRRLYQKLCDWEEEKVTALLALISARRDPAIHARRGAIVRLIQELIEVRERAKSCSHQACDVLINKENGFPEFGAVSDLLLQWRRP